MSDPINPTPPTPEPAPAPALNEPPAPSPAPAAKAKAADPAPASAPAPEEKSWFDALPDDLKGEKSVLRHASLEDAIRAGLGAEKRLGVPADQLVRLPTKPEEYADVYRKLGAPETPEGYKIGLPEKATEADKALASKFAQTMFEKGPFPPQFVAAAVDFINGETLAGMEAEATAAKDRAQAGEALLQKALGAKFDPEMKAVGKLLADYDAEIAKDLGVEPGGLADELNADGKGDNPRLMLMLQKISERLAEPGGIDGQGRGDTGKGGMSPAQAKAARLNLESDPVKGQALMDNSHSMHKSVVEERSRLIRLEEGLDPNG